MSIAGITARAELVPARAQGATRWAILWAKTRVIAVRRGRCSRDRGDDAAVNHLDGGDVVPAIPAIGRRAGDSAGARGTAGADWG